MTSSLGTVLQSSVVNSTHPPAYHWRELPQVSFLSRSFVATNTCLSPSRQNTSFVPTKVCLLRQKVLSQQNCLLRQTIFDSTKRLCLCLPRQSFVATSILLWLYLYTTQISLSRQNYVCHDKYVSRQKYVCHDKTFVATKMMLVAAPANYTHPHFRLF